jgi:hypothetical protein
MTPQLCACGHPESNHAEPTLFVPNRPCNAKWWVDGTQDCICADFIPAGEVADAA